MKLNKSILFLIFISLILVGCFLFSNFKYHQKNNLKINVSYSNPPRFLNDSIVNKLLTQNLPLKYSLQKDSLDLNMLETSLENTPYILNAEVFSFPEGTLGINIQERKPLLKIQDEKTYYLDNLGIEFPISESYSPLVPIFIGELDSFQKNNLLSLVNLFNKDPFLKSELKTIYYKSNSFYVGLKSYNFQVEIGTMSMVYDKILKLKVFCAYQNNNELQKRYKLISLKFKNQIVGS